jgi:menaquinone-9 beta-reductase
MSTPSIPRESTGSDANPALAPGIVIVGGGIAGATLAISLARAGCRVLVLESTHIFRDRVRGESMMPWGVAEAQRLGVADILHAAGAHTARLWKRYSEGEAMPRDLPVGQLIPGVAGSLNLHHPLACQALLDAAAESGATVERGVSNLTFTSGVDTSAPTTSAPNTKLSYQCQGVTRVIEACLVVGADGQQSIVRRHAGIELEQQEASANVAGLLLEGVTGPDEFDVVCENDVGVSLLMHQGGGRARAYQILPMEHRNRYVGDSAAEIFLGDATANGSPLAVALAHAYGIGPCASFAGTDTWTRHPYANGMVLIGDAAGHNDPSAGCGLSVAMRDARIVRDLILGGARSAKDFESYGAERSERLRRLRLIADVVTAATVETHEGRSRRRRHFAKAMASMNDALAPLVQGMFRGPETIPAHAATDAALERVRAL